MMERYLFIKDGGGVVSVQVSERLYEEITRWLEISEQQMMELFTHAETEDVRQIEVGVQMRTNNNVNSIFVKDRDYFRRIDFNQIRWIEASGSYCSLYLDKAPKLMLSFNLRELTRHLSSCLFIRVHRSYIVNINFVDSFIGNMLCIGENRIPVSKQHRSDLISRLNILGCVK